MIEQWNSMRRDLRLGSSGAWIEAQFVYCQTSALTERGVIWLRAGYYAAAARRSGEQRWDR
jgi:hypothetical protein